MDSVSAMETSNIRAVAFDADDTLWALQNHFFDVEREYCQLLSPFGDSEKITSSLFSMEMANMADLGYGCKAFIISLVENAVKVSEGMVEASVIGEIVKLGKRLLHVDACPLHGVEQTLSLLHDLKHADGSRRYRLAVFTKGELMDQENKLRRSGLLRFFDVVSIVSDKTPEAYHALCSQLAINPDQLLMVGNSFKSDIAPALAIGAYAAHIPFHTNWAHETTEEFEHDRLWRISNFSEILDILNL